MQKITVKFRTQGGFFVYFPLSTLHWMIADQTGTIVVESMKDGLHVYDNPVGVMTNNPPFPIMKWTV